MSSETDKAHSGNEPEDVKKHNEEMKNRAERATESVDNKDIDKEKVQPSFWSGKCVPAG